MRECNVRMFVTAEGTEGDWKWRNLAAIYVDAMLVQCLEPLLLAIPFNMFDAQSPLPHKLFFGKMAATYVNVVFGVHSIYKNNVLSGLKRMQALTDGVRGLSVATEDLVEPGEVSNYERLHTHGVKNIAVVGSFPRQLTPGEVRFLPKYTTIVIPNEREHTLVKGQLGPMAYPTVMGPTRFAVHIRNLL